VLTGLLHSKCLFLLCWLLWKWLLWNRCMSNWISRFSVGCSGYDYYGTITWQLLFHVYLLSQLWVLSKCWLAMNILSASDIPALRQHATICNFIHSSWFDPSDICLCEEFNLWSCYSVIFSILLLLCLGPHIVLDISFSDVRSDNFHAINFMINNAFIYYWCSKAHKYLFYCL
jgi:hypothetical protein